MVEILKNIVIPIIEVTFIFGIIGFVSFVLIRFFLNQWNTSWKFTMKYTIGRSKYDEKDVQFLMECFDKGWKYYDVKKYLLINNPSKVDELMWISLRMKGGLK